MGRRNNRGGSVTLTISANASANANFTPVGRGLLRYDGETSTCAVRGALVAVDVSGSTSGGILQAELQAIAHFAAPYIAWSHQIENIFSSTTGGWRSHGGTDPSALFTNTQTIQLLSERNVLVMTTDGQINQNAVQQFSTHFGRMSHITTCIGVLVCPAPHFGHRLDRLNISVFSAFMNRDCLVVWRSPNDPRLFVVYANGGFARRWPNLDLSDARSLPTLTSEELAALTVETLPSPEGGFISLGERTFVNLSQLLGGSQNERSTLDIDAFMGLNWDALFLLCKTRGMLRELRAFILRHQVKPTAPPTTNATEIVRLMQQIRTTVSNGSAEEARPLRERLHALRAADVAAAQTAAARAAASVRSMVQFHAELLQRLHAFERAGYNLAGVRSNRAARAETVGQHLTLEPSFLDGAFRAEDEIFGDEDVPMCVLVRAPADVSANTGDHALTFPLAITNREMQCPDFVGIESGQQLVAQGQDLMRQPVAGLIPFLNIRRPDVRAYVYQELCRLFTAGRDLKCVWRLFFAFLWCLSCREFSGGESSADTTDSTDDGESAESSRTLRDACRWMMVQVMDLHHTTPNFSADEISQRIPLREALGPFIGMPEFQQYEAAGCILIVEVAGHFQLPGRSTDGGARALRERMMRDLTQRLLAWLKRADSQASSLKRFRYAVERALFEFRCGVPTSGSARLVSHAELRRLLDRLGLPKLWRPLRADTPTLAAEQISVVLASFLADEHWPNYSAESLFMKFSHNGVFASAVAGDLDAEAILKFANHKFADLYSIPFVPPVRFATRLGPSVLEDERHNVSFIPEVPEVPGEFAAMVESIRDLRSRYFQRLYHVQVTAPTENCATYNLHKAVTCALAGDAQVVVSRETILRVLRLVRQSKGNIYEPELLLDILHAVWSYSHVHVRSDSIAYDARGPTVAEKLELELEARGATPHALTQPDFLARFPLPSQPPLPAAMATSDLVAPLTEAELEALE